jgi:hypothetical protein
MKLMNDWIMASGQGLDAAGETPAGRLLGPREPERAAISAALR